MLVGVAVHDQVVQGGRGGGGPLGQPFLDPRRRAGQPLERQEVRQLVAHHLVVRGDPRRLVRVDLDPHPGLPTTAVGGERPDRERHGRRLRVVDAVHLRARRRRGGVDQHVVRRRDPQRLGVEPDVVGDVVGQDWGATSPSRSVTTTAGRPSGRPRSAPTPPTVATAARGRRGTCPGTLSAPSSQVPSRRTKVFSSVLRRPAGRRRRGVPARSPRAGRPGRPRRRPRSGTPHASSTL